MEKIEKLYGGEIEISFKESSHSYKINGGKIPLSVTGVTGIVDKSSPLMWWAVGCMRDSLFEIIEKNTISKEDIEEARKSFMKVQKTATDVGSQVHAFAEKYVLWKAGKGERPEVPDDDQAINGVQAFISWINDKDIEFLEIEKLVYSKKHRYVGTFDVLAKIDGNTYLMDYKTSKGFYPIEMGMQLAGYQIALEEEFPDIRIEDRVILNFSKETGEFKEYFMNEYSTYQEDKEAFLSALALKKHQMKMQEKEKKMKKSM